MCDSAEVTQPVFADADPTGWRRGRGPLRARLRRSLDPASGARPAGDPRRPGAAGASMSETVFTYGSPQLKIGGGAADEVGYDVAQLGVRRALVVTDPGVAATG